MSGANLSSSPRLLSTLLAPFIVGVPVFIVLAVFLTEGGQTQGEVPLRDVDWPTAISGLPADVADLAVDDNGVLWFPVFAWSDSEGQQANLLYSYDPGVDTISTFPLPGDPGSGLLARIESGRGARAGQLMVGWESTLMQIDSATGRVQRLEVPLDEGKVIAGPEPPTTGIYDIAVGNDGTTWVSRDHYPNLIAIYPDGSANEFPLPEGAGTPEKLAIDREGRIWATLIRHRPVSNGPNMPATNAYRFTLRFDPVASTFDMFPLAAWNVAGRGGDVIGMVGNAPAPIQRLDTDTAIPVALTEFGPTLPGDELAVGSGGDVWFRSRSVPGLVLAVDTGAVAAFALPDYEIPLDSTGGGSLNVCVPEGQNHAVCAPQGSTGTAHTPVLAITVAPDGSAWFSTGNQIGHAVP